MDKPTLKKRISMGLLGVLCLGAVLLTASPAQANDPITVNATIDGTDKMPGNGVCETDTGNGICTLRAAINESNALPGTDTIILPPATYTLSLPFNYKFDTTGVDGDLDISDHTVLQGAGADSTIVNGNGGVINDGVFHVQNDFTVTFNDLAIENGDTAGNGGGILAAGPLVLNRVVIRQNRADMGGGIYMDGVSLTLQRSTIQGNTAAVGGGGIYLFGAGSSLLASHSLIAGNNAGTLGGGGLVNRSGTATLVNSTLSGNRANNSGGGLYNRLDGQANLYNVTIAANVADNDNDNSGSGGGIYAEPGSPVVIRNTLIGNNSNWEGGFNFTPDDCNGLVTLGGRNLIEAITGCTLGISDPNSGVQTGEDPQIGTLANNGGPTLTHALLATSPAIDTGEIDGCKTHNGQALTTDQRGYARPVDGGSGSSRCDIGAVEFGSTLPGVYLPVVIK